MTVAAMSRRWPGAAVGIWPTRARTSWWSAVRMSTTSWLPVLAVMGFLVSRAAGRRLGPVPHSYPGGAPARAAGSGERDSAPRARAAPRPGGRVACSARSPGPSQRNPGARFPPGWPVSVEAAMSPHPGCLRPFPGYLTIEHEPGGRRVLTLSGDVDSATVADFEGRQGRLPVVVDAIDAGAVPFLGSAGLEVLVSFAEAAAAVGRPPVLLASSGQVDRLKHKTKQNTNNKQPETDQPDGQN